MSAPMKFITVSGDGRKLHCNYTIDELIIKISELKNKLDWYENEIKNSEDEYKTAKKYFNEGERCVRKLKDLEWILECMNANNILGIN